MSLCTGAPAERSLERYIQGTLPELEARSFEEHYFQCTVCLAQVEALQAVVTHLAKQPITAPKSALKRLLALPLPATFGAIAATLILGLFGIRYAHRTQPADTAVAPPVAAQPQQKQTTSLASLADLSMPPYQAFRLRGEASDPSFDAGMDAYAKHDCGRALPALAKVAPAADDAVMAQFYTGICRMKENSLVEASVSLHKVAAKGDFPQREAAFYYLAQIALIRQDATEAQRDLARTISLRGDFEDRAREEMSKLH